MQTRRRALIIHRGASRFALGWLCGAVLLLAQPALAKDCHRGKKLCNGKCISAKKTCPDGDASAAAAPATTAAESACRKGKKRCGDTCIPAKKTCRVGATATSSSPAATSSAEPQTPAATALATPAGQAMLQLARALKQSGALDLEDRQRDAFRQSLRAVKPPQPLCTLGHNQLVKACEPLVGGTITLPCYLAADEMATFCQERLAQPMPHYR